MHLLWTWFHNTFIRQPGDPKRSYVRAFCSYRETWITDPAGNRKLIDSWYMNEHLKNKIEASRDK